jgi:hypothetical protein
MLLFWVTFLKILGLLELMELQKNLFDEGIQYDSSSFQILVEKFYDFQTTDLKSSRVSKKKSFLMFCSF